jgi:hypothetical protein
MHRLLPIVFTTAVLTALLSVPAQADCTCRAQGRIFEQGQAVCLSTPNGPRIATCGMVLNNSSWEFSQAPCVSSQALPQRRPAAAHSDHAQDKS